MQLLRTLTASLLVAVATLASTQSVDALHFFSANGTEVDVEPQDVAITNYNSAVVATALSDKRNFGPLATQPICVHKVTRVREAVANNKRELFIEVNGCSVKKPRGLCAVPVTCQLLPFEVHVVGPETTPGFDPVTAMVTQVAKGKAVKTPFVVQTIGILL